MNIKKIVTISLFVFGALVVIILGAGLYFNQKQPAPIAPLEQANNTTITAEQVSLHNSSNDCWVIVENKVYNVTNLIPIHSGGADKITPFCGKDATTAFETRGGKGPHPQRAQDSLNTYYVGNLN